MWQIFWLQQVTEQRRDDTCKKFGAAKVTIAEVFANESKFSRLFQGFVTLMKA